MRSPGIRRRSGSPPVKTRTAPVAAATVPAGATTSDWILTREPEPLEAMRAVLCVPSCEKVCEGYCAVEVVLSSKIQSQDVACGELVSVKAPSCPAGVEVRNEK